MKILLFNQGNIAGTTLLISARMGDTNVPLSSMGLACVTMLLLVKLGL